MRNPRFAHHPRILFRCAAPHYFGRPIPGSMIPVVGFAQKIFGKLAFALGTMWFDQRQDGGKRWRWVKKSVAISIFFRRARSFQMPASHG